MLITNNFNTFIPADRMLETRQYPVLRLRPQLSADTVSFGSKDLMQSSKDEISAKVKKALKDDKNFLGEGGEAQVYRIPDTDYCVKVLYADENYTSAIPDVLKTKNLKISTSLTEQDKINHNVAKFSHGTIMKYIEGSPVVSFSMSDEQIREVSKLVEDAPLSSFQKFLRQICHAYKHNMMFDCSYGNLIVNPKDKSMTVIDFYNMEAITETSHPLSHMYASLAHDKTTIEQRRTFASKILSAAIEELRPGHKPCLDICNFDYYRFIYKINQDNLIKKPSYVKVFINLFEEIENLKACDLRGENVESLLTGKLKVAKSLIKQVL